MPDYAHIHQPESALVRSLSAASAKANAARQTPDAEAALQAQAAGPAVSGVAAPRDVEKKALPEETDRVTGSYGEDDPYDRFSPTRKKWIVTTVAYSALLAPFASTSFLPSIPDIAEALSTSHAVVDYTVAIYLVILALAPLVWAPYASYYGRQPIYLLSLPLYVLGSVGVALSNSLVALILTRILQAFGASSVLSVGAGSIGDIYRPTERGTAMSWFYSLALLGPALSPVVAGLLTQYTGGRWGGWRAMQWTLAAMGVLAFGLVVAVLPETAWQRQCLKERQAAASSSEGQNATPRLLPFRWVWLDPIRPIWLLRHPTIALMSINSSFTLGTTYALLVPLTTTLGPRFNITNTALLGTFYLAPGFGNIVGARIAGRWSDRTVIKWIAKRGGDRVFEDRLRCSLAGGGAVLPLSILVAGAMMEYVMGGVGLGLALFFLAVSGAGLMMVLTPVNTYCVDVMQTRSAEVVACNNCLRYLFCAAVSAFVLPMIEAIGIFPTNVVFACLAWVGCGTVLATIKYGQRWREGVPQGVEGEEKKEVGLKEGRRQEV